MAWPSATCGPVQFVPCVGNTFFFPVEGFRLAPDHFGLIMAPRFRTLGVVISPTKKRGPMPTGVRTRTGLLISVRSAEEAAAALDAGADLIDVKDPTKGPLGMAHHETVAAVVEAVGGEVPVSAALGEWSPDVLTAAHWHLELPLTYVKWGLAGYKSGPAWGEELLETRRQVPAGVEVVAVAYADWEKANSVPPAEVARFAKRFRYRAFLLDTFAKDGKTLLDWMTPAEVAELVAGLKRGGVRVAVGGSLKLEQIRQLKGVAPDWFAVRGAVCAGGKRDGILDPVRVKKWKESVKWMCDGLAGTPPASAHALPSRGGLLDDDDRAAGVGQPGSGVGHLRRLVEPVAGRERRDQRGDVFARPGGDFREPLVLLRTGRDVLAGLSEVRHQPVADDGGDVVAQLGHPLGVVAGSGLQRGDQGRGRQPTLLGLGQRVTTLLGRRQVQPVVDQLVQQ